MLLRTYEKFTDFDRAIMLYTEITSIVSPSTVAFVRYFTLTLRSVSLLLFIYLRNLDYELRVLNISFRRFAVFLCVFE